VLTLTTSILVQVSTLVVAVVVQVVECPAATNRHDFGDFYVPSGL
jgi:hypothetical protein